MSKALVFALAALVSASSSGNTIVANTVFERAGSASQVDPLLLFAVALAESAVGVDDAHVSPHPWTLRAPDFPVYAESYEDARARLSELIQTYGGRVDVGLMQVSIHWHGNRVDDPATLLDPEQNVHLGAEILATAIASAPGDLELGVGRYHHWRDENKARQYGRRVLRIYERLQGIVQ